MSSLRALALLWCSCLVLSAAVGKEQAKQDALAVWAKQAEQVVEHPDGSPWFTGSQVWGGRADEDYKPFHQWELRLHAGTAERAGWRLRIIPLDSHFKAQNLKVVKPHWQELPKAAAGEAVELSYKLNCSALPAYRIELALDEETTLRYLAANQRDLPQLEKPGEKGAQLLASDVDFEYDPRRRLAGVVFFLANIGDQPAEEVRVTIHFLDARRKEVHSHVYVPGDRRSKGVIAPGYREQQKVLVKQVPKFHTIRLSTAKKEALVMDLAAGGDGEPVADIGLTSLKVEEGVLHAGVRNGLETGVKNLVLSIDLQNAEGETVKSVELTAAELAAGAEAELTAEVGEVSFSGYAMGFAYE